MSRFGFSTEASTGSGDFLPIVKYDARAGLFFRVDRVDTGNGFENHPTDITTPDQPGGPEFRAVFDLENLETGWIDFSTGGPPSFVMVKMSDLDAGKATFPAKPIDGKHKPGIRFMIKLANDLADSRPVREMASTAKAFVNGISELYKAYEAAREANPGKLPVVMIAGKAIPIKSGNGEKSSTNYQPRLRIAGWAPRGDLKPVPRGTVATANGHAVATNGAAPSTGSTQRAAPQARKPVPQEDDLSDFG